MVSVNTRPQLRTATPTVTALSALDFTGDLIPASWHSSPLFRHDSGQKYWLALLLYARICYWYRPTEQGGRKFAGDLLHINYEQWGEYFDVPSRQIADAVAFLVERGLLRREVRHRVRTIYGYLDNLVYVEPIADALASLCGPQRKEQGVGHAAAYPPPPAAVPSPTPQRVHTESRGDLCIYPLNVERSEPVINNTGEGIKNSPDKDTPDHFRDITKMVGKSQFAERLANPAQTPEPPERVDEAVRKVEAVTGDKHSRNRWLQLWHLCERYRCQSCWFDALFIVEERVRLGRANIPGALFQRLLQDRVEARGVSWPDLVGYVADDSPEDIRKTMEAEYKAERENRRRFDA